MDNLDLLIKLAIDEDLGGGDITSEAVISKDSYSKAFIRAKSDLVLAGTETARRTFLAIDKSICWTEVAKDGDHLKAGDTIAEVCGPTIALLAGERTALNFLQRLSGIATLANKFAEVVAGTNTKILDTRKTTPGFRLLEKMAACSGGVKNHRLGLYDHFLIKNNHIAAAGSVAKAIQLAKKHRAPTQMIEVEVRTDDELSQAIAESADIIMLDNMTPSQVADAVKKVSGRAKIEVSGNMTLEKVREYAIAGVDYISVGAITHSSPSADIHMVIEPVEKTTFEKISSAFWGLFRK